MTTRRVKRIDELAQDLPPPRDLWPAIASAIEADAAQAAPVPARGSGWRPTLSTGWATAAAVALVAVGVWIGSSLAPSGDVTRIAATPGGQRAPEQISASLQRDEKYRQQRDVLLVEVGNRLKSMPAAEREKVAASLATLRRSIAEIEAALGRDPANALLQELLVSSCQEEMRALTAVRDSGSQES